MRKPKRSAIDISDHHGRFLGRNLFRRMNKYLKIKKNKDVGVVSPILKKIFENIGNELLDSDDGVYMKGMGYFYIFMNPMPNMRRKNICAERVNLIHTSGRRYYISFEPIGEKNPFMGYTLDHMVTENLKNRMQQKIIEGKRYKQYLSSFRKVKQVST